MRKLSSMAALLALVSGSAAAAQYQTPANPPDPAVQLAEMLELYDAVCLRAFPDDAAAARAMAARGASALSEREVRVYLHDDPGRGWRLAGRTARFDVTVEAPPFRACGVRTLTAAGFPDMRPYRALADRFEAGGGYRRLTPSSLDIGNVRTSAGGERRMRPDGGTESLLVLLATPVEGHRDHGQTGVEVRFVHQFARDVEGPSGK